MLDFQIIGAILLGLVIIAFIFAMSVDFGKADKKLK